MKEELSKATRTESDLIGEREVPETALYGVQTLRGDLHWRNEYKRDSDRGFDESRFLCFSGQLPLL